MSNTQSTQYFLKGDISGIQEFIFNVKSEGAAKSLKGRSFFIHALSLICIKMIEDELGKQNVEVFYNGGGNFYLLLKNDPTKEITSIQEIIDRDCHENNFYVTLSIIKLDNYDIDNQFGDAWNALNLQSEKDKLTKFKHYPLGYAAYPSDTVVTTATIQFDWKALTGFLKKEPHYDIIKDIENRIEVNGRGVKIFGYHLTYGTTSFENIVLQLPRWTPFLLSQNPYLVNENAIQSLQSKADYVAPEIGFIIEFSFLAGFAKKRTGTRKIGILKLDVDNLGTIFSLLSSKKVAGELSHRISIFFGDTLNDLLALPISSDTENSTANTFRENIYTVFAGGDDCFFVGAWDVILQWATLLQEQFTNVSQNFNTYLVNANQEITTDLKKHIPLTISGGLVMLDPTYPTTRFADLAGDALDDAKYFVYPGEQKYDFKKAKINLLNQVLTWKEYDLTLTTANELKDLVIKEGEPRSTIEKLRSTAKEFEHLYNRANINRIQGPAVSKLFYHIRNSPNHATLSQTIVTPFAKDLIGIFAKGDPSNPLKYPLAARIAEFLTRNYKA